MNDEITVLGKKYTKQGTVRSSKAVGKTAATMAALGYDMDNMITKMVNKAANLKKPDHPVNIVHEYALILEKKSSLTARERDWVVAEFKSNYKEV